MTRTRSIGHWLILLGTLGTMFAAAVEGHFGRVPIAFLVVLAAGAGVATTASALYRDDEPGTPSFARSARIGVPTAIVFAGGVGATFTVEGRAGPATFVAVAVLGIGALTVVVTSLLYAVDVGAPRFALEHRIGIPLVAVVAAALGATTGVEGPVAPATLLGMVLLVVAAALRLAAPALFARDDGVARVPLELRVGVPVGVGIVVPVGMVVAAEGRIVAATVVSVLLLVVAWGVRLGAPVLYDTDDMGDWRCSRNVRVRVPIATAIVVGLATTSALEGGLGPATLGVVAVLGMIPVVRAAAPVLYGINGEGRPRFSRGFRFGVPIALLFTMTLGALAATLDSSSPEIIAASPDRVTQDDDAGDASTPSRDEAPRTSEPPEAEIAAFSEIDPHATPVIGRWDTVGSTFADATCIDRRPLDGAPGEGGGSPIPLDAFTQVLVDSQLDAAQAYALRFPTVAHAEAAGYRMLTERVPCMGAHYIRWDVMNGDLGLVDDVFDPAEPEILRYEGTSPESVLVGVSYFLASETRAGGFAGGNEHWHQLQWLCVTDGVVTGIGVPPEACGGPEQRWFSGHDLWIAPAWVVPGWENPLGVFASGHAGLR